MLLERANHSAHHSPERADTNAAAPQATPPRRSGIVIRQVHTEEERQAVFRLRYDVLVTELGMRPREADDARRMMQESCDVNALVLGAFDDGRLVGTIRIRYGRRADFGLYESLFQMSLLKPFFPERVSFTDRLVVHAEYRRGTTASRLCIAGFVFLQEHDVALDVICSQPHNRDLFIKLGYQQVLPDVEHPFGGRVHPMVLNLHDPDHLIACRSPFSRVVDPARRDPAVGELLQRIRDQAQTGKLPV